jgi:hypothetical protein
VAETGIHFVNAQENPPGLMAAAFRPDRRRMIVCFPPESASGRNNELQFRMQPRDPEEAVC